MAFLDDTGTLEDALGKTADDQANTIDQQYAKKRRQSIAQNAHSGRLMSGVANYDAGDLNAAEAGDIGDVYGNLTNALGAVPLTDYTNAQDDARKRKLAELLGSLNSPSGLEEALGGLATGAQLASTAAAFI